MPHTPKNTSANGIITIEPQTLVNGQVHYEVQDGILLMTKVSETGCGTHTRFIHGVAGIHPPTPSRNIVQAADEQNEQARTHRKASQGYRESQDNAFSPVHSFTSADDDEEMMPGPVPSTPRADRTSIGAQTTPGGRPLVRSPPIVLDAPSLGNRAEAWIAQKVNGRAPNTRPDLNGTWHNVLESLPMTVSRVEKRRQIEDNIIDREWKNLRMEHELTWETINHDVRKLEGMDIDDSELDESEYASSICDGEMAHGDSEHLVEEQLREKSMTNDDMEDLYVDPEHETHSSAGGTPHASFTSIDSSTSSELREQFGVFHKFAPRPIPSAIPEDVEVEDDFHNEVRRAMAEQGDAFYNLSTSGVSTSTSSSEAKFGGFPSKSRLGTSAPAPSPVVLGDASRAPAHAMRYVTPDNAFFVNSRDVPPAPTRVRTHNPSLRDQLSTSQESSAFSPTPGLTPRQAEKYVHHREEQVELRDTPGGLDRRKKTVRWRDPTPLPSRDGKSLTGSSSTELIGTQRLPLTHAEKRLELQRKLYGIRAPELKKRGNVLLKPASQVRAESQASTQIDADLDNTPNVSFSDLILHAGQPVAGPSGVGRTDSLKENVKPLSSLSPGRAPLQVISEQQSIPVPVFTPVNVRPIIRGATPKTPGSSSKSRRKSDVETSPMLTRSKARATGQEERGSTPRSSAKGKGRA